MVRRGSGRLNGPSRVKEVAEYNLSTKPSTKLSFTRGCPPTILSTINMLQKGQIAIDRSMGHDAPRALSLRGWQSAGGNDRWRRNWFAGLFLPEHVSFQQLVLSLFYNPRYFLYDSVYVDETEYFLEAFYAIGRYFLLLSRTSIGSLAETGGKGYRYSALIYWDR
ncbi:uncharacterized protein BBA_10044 [Beauveria bassiana ARSEF 2860]|uniref:Uncharacterized protein n=1 Tax=Beauveria bassiana (strain ARSEF 2860) TaxID=655819 RepID=J5J2D3_BEAB2|nr:uncharacterized protein BBA_10044 [Beauveria bassiana ARSEF 2860]EJP61008.1 hypothetical protein BBA_10044 [Beauveria bassiana ARSEF 2860]